MKYDTKLHGYMNKIIVIYNIILQYERGLGQRRRRGTELPCMLRQGLSLQMRRLSRTSSSSWEEHVERILKSSREAIWPVLLRWERMLDDMGLVLFRPVRGETPKCSETRVCRWRAVWPIYDAEQQRHLKEYTTLDLRAFGILSL